MKKFVNDIKKEFEKHRDLNRALYMKAYMKNHFEFLGVDSPTRRQISRPFLMKTTLPPVNDLWPIVKYFWQQAEREYQYFAMELIVKYHKNVEKDWIDQYESIITGKSWWDTVDFIASTLAGHYFRKFPAQVPSVTRKWMASGNMWLQRSCLLFQLKYQYDTDTRVLSSFISPLAQSKEFFIAKAIGWALREYSKYNPGWVLEFVENTHLQPLSKKEALRRII
jgi:3-methyladenine DNA glycosylase AlkD